jgi:hypothetical protein
MCVCVKSQNVFFVNTCGLYLAFCLIESFCINEAAYKRISDLKEKMDNQKAADDAAKAE